MLVIKRPCPPLSELVEVFWVSEQPVGPCGKERVLPSGCAELIVSLDNDLLPVFDRSTPEVPRGRYGGVLAGPHSAFQVVDPSAHRATIGIAFKPGGALPFLPMPLSEGHNQVVPLDLLWGRVVDDLREELLLAGSTEARFAILERWLIERAARPKSWHPAVQYGLRELGRAPQTLRISELVDRIGISHRRFSQLFQEQVGLTPKLFCRVRRFQQVLRHIQHQQQVDWADLALSCGYFDQAHLIRDFHDFAGLSPSRYLALRSEFPNHLPL